MAISDSRNKAVDPCQSLVFGSIRPSEIGVRTIPSYPCLEAMNSAIHLKLYLDLRILEKHLGGVLGPNPCCILEHGEFF